VSNHVQDWNFDLRSYRKFFSKPEPSFEQISISKKIKRKRRSNSLTSHRSNNAKPQRIHHVRKVKIIDNYMSIAVKNSIDCYFWSISTLLCEISFTDQTKYSNKTLKE